MRIRQKIGSHRSILCSVRIHLLPVVKVCCFRLEVGDEGLDHTVVCYTSTSVLLHSQSTRPCDCSHPSVPSPIHFPSPELLLGIKQWDQLPSLSGLKEDPPIPAPCSSSGFTLGGCRPFFGLCSWPWLVQWCSQHTTPFPLLWLYIKRPRHREIYLSPLKQAILCQSGQTGYQTVPLDVYIHIMMLV